MTADAYARVRAGRPALAPAPLLAVEARRIERIAEALGVDRVDRMLNGYGTGPDVLKRRARVPVHDRAQRAVADARDDRAHDEGLRDLQRDPSRRRWTAGSIVLQRPCRAHRGCVPVVLDGGLIVASQPDARVWSDLRLVALWWSWSCSRWGQSAVAGSR